MVYIFHTPHFPHSAFSTLLIFHTPHSTFSTEPFSLKQRLVISLILKGSVLVNVDLVIVYEKGIMLWNV